MVRKRVDITLDPDLVRQVKHYCVDRGKSLSGLVEELLRNLLGGVGK